MSTLIDGKRIAETIRADIATKVAEFQSKTGVTPGLAAVLVGDNPASEVYVRNKQIACEKVGITSRLVKLPQTTQTPELLDLVDQLNRDRSIHGILVQLPLPSGCDELKILDAIDPLKDVDAFHPENVGLISQGRPRYLPCTPYGVQQMLVHANIEISGKHVVIIGRSDIVGKPMGLILIQKGREADATVTICHSRTKNLPEITRLADILIVAIGRANFVTADMVRPGAAVIDVGMNRLESGKLCGDVDFEAVKEIAGAITPVPGGVGPLTITMLLLNTLTAAKVQSANS